MNLRDYLGGKWGEMRRLAYETGVTPQAVYNWSKTRVPAERVFDVYRLTGGAVKPEEMRPDLFSDLSFSPKKEESDV